MQQIKIDFDNPGFPQRLDVVENDAQSRFFNAVLYKDGKAYTAPSGATYSIMYRGFGPQNEGWYDTINDGAGKRAACSVSGNVVTCEIARQALRVPGHVSVMLCVTGSNGYMLHGWPIDCNCRNDSYTGGTSVESFFYITQVTNADWTSAIQTWEELKNMIDPTLSVSGKAADAKETGDKIGQLKEDLVNAKDITYKLDTSWNLIEKRMFEKGFLDEDTGIESNNASTFNSRTGFIEISNIYNTLTFYRLNPSCALYFYFYDANKSFISRKTNSYDVTNDRHGLPSGTKYVRIATYKAGSASLIDLSETLCVYKGPTTHHYYSKPRYIISENGKKFNLKVSSNEFDNSCKWYGGDIGNDGILYNDEEISSSWCSDFMSVVGGKKYIMSWVRNYDIIQAYIAQYRADYSFISKTNIGKYNSYSLTLDSSCAFIRLLTWNNTYKSETDCILHNVLLNRGDFNIDYKEKYIVPFENIETPFDIEKDVPAYYYSQLNERIPILKALLKENALNGDSFIFITDMHWKYNQKHSPAIIKYLCRYLNINHLFNGGDTHDGLNTWFNDGHEKYHSMIERPLKLLRESFDGNIFNVVGNHEYFTYSDDTDIFYALQKNTKNVVWGNRERQYYYYDNTDSKIRYIVLNSYSYNGSSAYIESPGFEEAQRWWFSNTALDMPTGYIAIVFAHAFYKFDDITALTSVTALSDDIISIIDISKDKIACLIQGHTHTDRIVHTPQGVPCVMTTCDKNVTSDEGTRLDYRITYTNQEQAFDVVCVDRNNRKLSFVRIGGNAKNGQDENHGEFCTVREVTY